MWAKSKVVTNIITDFIHVDNWELTVTTNNITLSSDLSTIERYIKNIDIIDSDNIMALWLPQSKSYLKILGILYFIENTNVSITSDIVERVIKSMYIFNNITLASKPRVIKTLPKSDIAVIWIDIWDIQSSNKAKRLINKCFNVSNYIATIYSINMNPGIPQCKNCWKWKHTTFACHSHGTKYIKYNNPHKVKYHWHFAWCCKLNFKNNPLRLETK